MNIEQQYQTPNFTKKPSSLRYYQEGVPSVEPTQWQLQITEPDGLKHELTLDQLHQLPHTTTLRRMVCVCNWTIKREWTGVLLRDLFRHHGIDLTQWRGHHFKQSSVGTQEKGVYESWVELDGALERDAMLAWAVDGSPLPPQQGFPLRFIDFGLYNYKNVKGLARIDITPNAQLGHWEQLAGYSLDGTIKPKRYWAVDLRQHRFAATPGEVTSW